MGRSNPNTYIPNPAKITVSWSGEKGIFFVYDSEKKERVELDLPFRFAWVESLASITGYNEPNEFFIRSNEVKDLKKEELCVCHYEADGEKFKKVVDFEGFYADIKDSVKSKEYGGRYTTVAYAVADGDNGIIKNGDLVRIEIAGAALNAWIDKGFSHYDGGVCVEEPIAKKKGAVNYFQPIFKQEQISSDLDAKAFAADKLVKAWIEQDDSSGGGSGGGETAEEKPSTAPQPDAADEYEDDVPF